MIGSLPTEIGNLSRLTSLVLAREYIPVNMLTFPSEISHLTNMMHLRLENLSTPNTAWFVDALEAMTALTSLYLTDQDGVTGFVPMTIPEEIGMLTALELLGITKAAMTGTVPTTLARLTKLTVLDVSYNHFVGTIPTELGLLTNLNILKMHDNDLAGFLPSEIGALSNLSVADFARSELSWPVPSEVCALGIEIIIPCEDNSDFFSPRDTWCNACP